MCENWLMHDVKEMISWVLLNFTNLLWLWCGQYIDTTVTQMSEAWEDILLEMDSKLKKLAEDKYVCSLYFSVAYCVWIDV